MRKFYYLVFCILFSSIALAAETPPTQFDFSNYQSVKKYVEGDDTENTYLKLKWHTSVLDGQIQAVKADKPLLLWLYFGNPLGRC